jgi:hypothetical protein
MEDSVATSEECLHGIEVPDIGHAEFAVRREDFRDVFSVSIGEIVNDADQSSCGSKLTAEF